ncbi:hypothetical protein CKO25_15535 [Thiocapsa imhoffii]|uniref:Uncharacterized protein n=1 Tax=Thiocapsa imhoffii TaxID=382777 RepID=A0A9X0WJT5_9GAMM|nr:hypothetical protein [Thiocapsa imhoffii]
MPDEGCVGTGAGQPLRAEVGASVRRPRAARNLRAVLDLNLLKEILRWTLRASIRYHLCLSRQPHGKT